MSVPERIQLVEDIWDSIVEVPEEVGLTDELKMELDQRLAAYHQNPEEGSPWAMVRERIVVLSVFRAKRNPKSWKERI